MSEGSTLRVAVVGGYGHAEMTESVVRGFEHLGCTVTLVPMTNWRPRVYSPRVRGTGLLTRVAGVLALPWLEGALVEALRRARPDVVLLLKTDDLHRTTYRAIRRFTGARLAAFHPDDPFPRRTGWTRAPSTHPRSVLQMREVDTYFVWSRAFEQRAVQRGARSVRYVPFACDPVLHGGTNGPDALPADRTFAATFVGNWDLERERVFTPLAASGLGLRLFGTSDWRFRCTQPLLRSAWEGAPAMGEAMVRVVRSTKVNINVLRLQNKDACNMRTFEIPCCGGFMLHERSRDLPALFKPGVECDDFGTPEELVMKVRYYLERDSLREEIAARGKLASERHTYAHWAWRILDGLGLGGRVPAPAGAALGTGDV